MVLKITKEELNKIIDGEEYLEIKLNNFDDLFYFLVSVVNSCMIKIMKSIGTFSKN